MTGKIFEQIGKIIENNPRIMNYTITGYKYVDTRLVLHFMDCNQVFDFKEVGDEIVVNKFFTKNWSDEEYYNNNQAFMELHEKEQPELSE